MGLGLASSYDVIIGHGGEMRVESELGKGATFRVILPLTHIKEGCEKNKRKAGGSLKDMKGLVIDDEPSITRVVYEYLKGEVCRMKTAADVKTALDMLGENSFDFVVCDIKMPEMGRSEFHQFIKEMKPLLLGRIIYKLCQKTPGF
jgi:two-component system NtrC family sensor kinase